MWVLFGNIKLGRVFFINDVLSRFTLFLRNVKRRLTKFDKLAPHKNQWLVLGRDNWFLTKYFDI